MSELHRPTIDQERDDDGQTKWRWRCCCLTKNGRRRAGQWTWQSENVAYRAWMKHAGLRT